jgi:hypothetical protein
VLHAVRRFLATDVEMTADDGRVDYHVPHLGRP